MWKQSYSLKSADWAMLFSSLPPVDLISGADGCDATKKACVQMYISMGTPELLDPLSASKFSFFELDSNTVNAPNMSQASNMSYASNSSNSSNTSHTSYTTSSLKNKTLSCTCWGPSHLWQKERNEKNWIPFSVDIGTYFVYSISPHVVLTGRPGDGLCVKSYSTTAFKPINELAEKVGAQYIRGSATAGRFGPDRFLALIHTSSKRSRIYDNGVHVSASPPFEILAVSRPIPLSGWARLPVV